MSRRHLRATTTPALLALFTSLSTSPSWGDEPRSRGLGGSYTSRDLTEPRNAMALLLGPLQPPLFGTRYSGGVVDGGLQYSRSQLSGDAGGDAQNTLYVGGGVAFGLFDDLEAGALFLRFELAPDFAYDDVNVFITRQFRLGNFDIAARLSFRTPTRTDWALTPSLPVLVRLGAARVDTGLFFSFELGDDERQGLNVPVRLSYNVTPSWFVGAQTGVYEPDFGTAHGLSVPAGAFVGYTMLVGARVIDWALSFDWDALLLPSPAEGVNALQPGSFRIGFGASLHSSVL